MVGCMQHGIKVKDIRDFEKAVEKLQQVKKQEDAFVERQSVLRANKKINKHFAQFTANERLGN